MCENENIEGLSILGGEPMNPKNIEGTTKLAKAFKQKFPDKICGHGLVLDLIKN